MKTTEKFKEYIWLVNTIFKARKITLAEINEKWVDTDMSGGVALARSTFNRHKDAIEDIFGIYIDCDRQNGYKYYIGNANVLREDTIQNWMLSTLSVNNVISESLSLQNRILLQDVPNRLNFEPYCIKLFKQRWYILGHFHRDATGDKPESDYFGMFSFDRILTMRLTDIKFQIDPDFDAKAYFEECFGVLVGDGTEPERIVIRVYGNERYYLRDLPIHSSQREIGHGEDFADFELTMRPTIDLSAHLLSRGSQIKVLSPAWLADEIHDMHLEAAVMYETENLQTEE